MGIVYLIILSSEILFPSGSGILARIKQSKAEPLLKGRFLFSNELSILPENSKLSVNKQGSGVLLTILEEEGNLLIRLRRLNIGNVLKIDPIGLVDNEVPSGRIVDPKSTVVNLLKLEGILVTALVNSSNKANLSTSISLDLDNLLIGSMISDDQLGPIGRKGNISKLGNLSQFDVFSFNLLEVILSLRLKDCLDLLVVLGKGAELV